MELIVVDNGSDDGTFEVAGSQRTDSGGRCVASAATEVCGIIASQRSSRPGR